MYKQLVYCSHLNIVIKNTNGYKYVHKYLFSMPNYKKTTLVSDIILSYKCINKFHFIYE